MKNRKIKWVIDAIKISMIFVVIVFAVIVFISCVNMAKIENSQFVISNFKAVMAINICYPITFFICYYYSKRNKSVFVDLLPMLHIIICVVSFIYYEYLKYYFYASIPHLVH